MAQGWLTGLLRQGGDQEQDSKSSQPLLDVQIQVGLQLARASAQLASLLPCTQLRLLPMPSSAEQVLLAGGLRHVSGRSRAERG